jgi:hypothetical protein
MIRHFVHNPQQGCWFRICESIAGAALADMQHQHFVLRFRSSGLLGSACTMIIMPSVTGRELAPAGVQSSSIRRGDGRDA